MVVKLCCTVSERVEWVALDHEEREELFVVLIKAGRVRCGLSGLKFSPPARGPAARQIMDAFWCHKYAASICDNGPASRTDPYVRHGGLGLFLSLPPQCLHD